MQAILVRVGVDHSFGKWNAPIDPLTNEFVYVPIPEKQGTEFHPSCDRPYELVLPSLTRFAEQRSLSLHADLRFPEALLRLSMHLDPDFSELTYGDNGARRGAGIRTMQADDVIVFYSGLRPTRECKHKLIYAITGLYVIREIVEQDSVPANRIHENAHTRKIKRGLSDIVVRAKPGVSGRLRHALPVGEYRDRAYRVRTELLETWGDLSVNDGYIQRSAIPPRFLQPDRFLSWFQKQGTQLLAMNNP